MHPRKYHIIGRLITLCLAIQALGACSMIYEYDHCPDELSVRSDWRFAPEARPESMAYLFFSTYTHDLWRFDLPEREGGAVALPAGEYSLLCINDDSGTTLLSDPTTYHQLTATTKASTLYGSLGGPTSLDGEAVRSCPSQMWGQAIDKVCLSDAGVAWTPAGSDSVEFSSSRVLTVYPRPMMASYTFEITDVSNLDGVRHMCAAITGMASDLTVCTLHCSGPCVTLPLKATRQGSSTVTGSFLTIGLPHGETVPNRLLLFVWLTDGRSLSYSFDVSRQTREAPDPMNVHLRVGGIDLPPSEPVAGGAFDVSVDGWIETVIVIDS